MNQKTILTIINHPILRIIGIGAILYYGLFKNSSNPDSLRNRLAPAQVKSNLKDLSQHSVFILENVKKAKEIKKDNNTTTNKTNCDDKSNNNCTQQ